MNSMSLKYTPENTGIAVIGGGNIGTQFACLFSSKGYCVNVHSSKPEEYDGILEMVNEKNEVTCGKLNIITSDIGKAVENCSIVFVTHPAFKLKSTAMELLPYIKKGMKIVVIPGTGGAEFSFYECVRAGALLYGLQRVPSVSRLEKYGKRVRCEGLRDKLHIASFPCGNSEIMAGTLEYVFGIPCEILPNYLCVTLTPSNPILHTTRLRTLFSDYFEGKIYERNPLFYGEWSDSSSELLLACDDELQQVCRKIEKMDLTAVRSLKLHYESDTVEKMTKKIGSIKSLHNLVSPMKKVDGGWIPDFNSRYFTADFPYGLAIIEEIAELAGVEVPYINATMSWYHKVTNDFGRLDLKQYGIDTLEDIYKFYM